MLAVPRTDVFIDYIIANFVRETPTYGKRNCSKQIIHPYTTAFSEAHESILRAQKHLNI
jgi:hypothetical protein